VVVRTGNIGSNFATIPVAASGRTCAEPALGITSDLLAKPSLTFGAIGLNKDMMGYFSQILDSATAQFVRIAPGQIGPAFGYPSVDSCIAVNGGGLAGLPQGDLLDAGAAISVDGPNGKATLYPSGDYAAYGFYNSLLWASASNLPIFIPPAGGTFNFDNGAGGADVKAFTGSITLGAPLVWSNQSALSTVNRSSGLTVNWSGGSAAGYVRISGSSTAATGKFTTVSASFVCTAPAAANQFTVPAPILSALPPTGSGTGSSGSLSVAGVTNGAPFVAPGLDAGLITATVSSTIQVSYQ
jgi:hypothetical protein